MRVTYLVLPKSGQQDEDVDSHDDRDPQQEERIDNKGIEERGDEEERE